MEISKVLKTKKGLVTFEGKLSEEEHEFILNIGLMTLLEQGAIPFTSDEDDKTYVMGPNEVQ